MTDHHSGTKFTPFSLPLEGNAGACTGIACIPNCAKGTTPTQDYARPLLVGLHGGGCTSVYFDLTPENSAASVSAQTAIPFVSIDRTGYSQSTCESFLHEWEDFWKNTSLILHTQILPRIWKAFGLPHGCSGIVLVAHSFGCPPAIMAAALHAQEAAEVYPLAGLILSGYGVLTESGVPLKNVPASLDTGSQSHIQYSFVTSKLLMLAGDEPCCYSAGALRALEDQPSRQIAPVPIAELQSAGRWTQSVAKHAGGVNVPVWNVMAEGDWLIEPSPEAMRRFEALFVHAPGLDSSIIRGAPHAIEWSKVAYGYYLRCFGWASEVVNANTYRI